MTWFCPRVKKIFKFLFMFLQFLVIAYFLFFLIHLSFSLSLIWLFRWIRSETRCHQTEQCGSGSCEAYPPPLILTLLMAHNRTALLLHRSGDLQICLKLVVGVVAKTQLRLGSGLNASAGFAIFVLLDAIAIAKSTRERERERFDGGYHNLFGLWCGSLGFFF